MLKGISKFFKGTLLLMIVLDVAGLLILRFSPQTVLAVVSKLTPYQITSSYIETELFPLSVDAKDLVVHLDQDKDEIGDAAFIAKSVSLKVDYAGYFMGNPNVILSSVNNAFLDVTKLRADALSSDMDDNQDAGLAGQAWRVDAHPWLSLFDARVEDFMVKISDSSILEISSLDSQFDLVDSGSEASNGERSYSIGALFKDSSTELHLNAKLTSVKKNGINILSLDSQEIDLTKVLASRENEALEKTQSEESKVVDFGWLKSIAPTRFKMNVDRLILGDNSVSNLNASVLLDRRIKLESANFDIKWNLNRNSDQKWKLVDSFSLNGELEPTKKNMAEVSLVASSKVSTLSISGKADLLEPLKSDLAINLASSALPLNESDTNQQTEALAQWFPFEINANLSPNGEGESAGILIDIKAITAGDSDLQGRIELGSLAVEDKNKPLSVKADLSSNLLALRGGQELGDEARENPPESKSSDKLFPNTEIDWSWLTAYQIDAKLKVAKLQFDQRVLEDVTVPLVLGADGLQIESFQAHLGDGAINAQADVKPSEQGASLKLDLIASGMDLSSLHLVDDSLLKGGDTLLKLSLTSDGLSPHTLMSNLTGQILFQMKEATIGNNAFELIGSDLFISLLSKLNPFLKSDPTTELKCAVVNLNVNEGIVDVNKSIAMETSKMVIVADGKVNLAEETLDLGITPKTRQGVGLDVSTLIKFLKVGGTLSNPKPSVDAGGLLKSGAALTAAVSTGGASLLLDGLVAKMASGKACERALSAK